MNNNKPSVLIIDDEPENLTALKRHLGDENPGWLIFTAPGEEAGKQVIKDQILKNEPIDVLITDLVMESENSGMNIIEYARRLDPAIMTILFTAKEKNLDRYAAFELGAFDVVEKNIRGVSAAREILIKTRAALGFRRQHDHLAFLRRYFDPKVFSSIENNRSILNLSPKTITIVFWDIRGFSKLCHTLKAHPTLIADFLREYMETAAKTIFSHNGCLDKFIGDGVMSLFGVLNHQADNGARDAINAVGASIDMFAAFDEVYRKWLQQWRLYTAEKIDIGIGCGVHTAETLVGNVGTEFRDQFTALGDPVNLASRFEAKAKAGQILISQSTQSRIQNKFKVQKAITISDIKNIPGEFDLFEIIL